MDEKSLYTALSLILERLESKDVLWRLDGSVNLLVQGVNVKPRDLDICTNHSGLQVFKKLLGDFLVNEGFNKKTNSEMAVFNIHGISLEINNYLDSRLSMLEKTKRIDWKGLLVPVLPIKLARKFYLHIGRDEKVQLIDDFIKKQGVNGVVM